MKVRIRFYYGPPTDILPIWLQEVMFAFIVIGIAYLAATT